MQEEYIHICSMIYGPLIVNYFKPKGMFRLILNGAIYWVVINIDNYTIYSGGLAQLGERLNGIQEKGIFNVYRKCLN